MNKELIEALDKRERELLEKQAPPDVDGMPELFDYKQVESLEVLDDKEEEQFEPQAPVDLDRVEPSFVCAKEKYTILFSDVSIAGGFEPCGLLFQQVWGEQFEFFAWKQYTWSCSPFMSLLIHNLIFGLDGFSQPVSSAKYHSAFLLECSPSPGIRYRSLLTSISSLILCSLANSFD